MQAGLIESLFHSRAMRSIDYVRRVAAISQKFATNIPEDIGCSKSCLMKHL